MKKIFTLFAATLMVASAMAEVMPKASELRVQQISASNLKKVSVLDTKAHQFDLLSIAKSQAAFDADTLAYFPSYHVLFGGWDQEGYSMMPSFFQRPQDTVTMWLNDSYMYANAAFAWSMSSDLESPISMDSDLVLTPDLLFDDYDQMYQDMLPALISEQADPFYYGDALVNLYAKHGYEAPTFWMSLPKSFYYPLTNCMLYTNSQIGGEYMENNVDPWFWDVENGGSYIFGTGFPAQNAPVLVQEGYTKSPDSLYVFFGYEDEPMSIDTVNIQYHSLTDDFLPAGSGITVQLFDETGKIGEYTATIADTVNTYVYGPEQTGLPGVNWHHGQLNFPIKATAKGKVEALIYGFNANNANIGFKADNNNYSRTTYHVVNGKLVYYWIANIAMTFNVKFEDSTEAISNNTYAAKAIKAVRNGQIVIEKGNKKYNLLGAAL